MNIEVEIADLNLLHNLTNPYQTDAKRVLTVCSAGLLRSPSTAVVLNKEFGYNCRSCGIDSNYALVPISHALIHWADEIVVMEHWMIKGVEDVIKAIFGNANAESYISSKPIICLNIRDNYGYMDDNLQDVILRKYEEADTNSALQNRINKGLNIRD